MDYYPSTPHDVAACGPGNGLANGMEKAEQLRALREERRLVGVLLEDIGRTRHRLDIEPGAGAAWQSAAQKLYMLRRFDLRSRFGMIVWMLEEAGESLTGTITELVRG